MKNLRNGKARPGLKVEGDLNHHIRISQDVSICFADKVLCTHYAGGRELTGRSLIPSDVQKLRD